MLRQFSANCFCLLYIAVFDRQRDDPCDGRVVIVDAVYCVCLIHKNDISQVEIIFGPTALVTPRTSRMLCIAQAELKLVQAESSRFHRQRQD